MIGTLAGIPEDATWYLYRDDTSTPKYTLTLNNFVYSGAGYSGSGIYAAGDLTIVLWWASTASHKQEARWPALEYKPMAH